LAKVGESQNIKSKQEVVLNPLRADPTRLQGLRRPTLWAVQAKYKNISEQIRQKIIDEHFLQGVPESPLIADGLVNFDTEPSDETAYNTARVDELELWLSGLVTQLIHEDFVAEYIERAYAQGRKRAYTDSNKSKLKPQPNVTITNAADFQEGGKEAFIQSGETSPTSKKTKQSLISQAFSSLRGLAGQMVQSVKQIILTGIRKLWTPKQITKAVQDEISKYEKRTEVSVKDDLVRAHGESQLDAFAELGHNNVTAIIETAGDNRVCSQCRVLEGRELPIEQARGLIPVHKNCRCVWKPVPPRLTISDKEKEKRKKETIKETVVRLQLELTKLQTEEEKAAKRAKAKPNNAELRNAAELARLNRLKLEIQVLERRAAQMRIVIEHTRHLAEDFIRSQAELQKELESKRIDNDGYSDTEFAKFVIERERLVELVKDALLDLPDVDDYLKEADKAYNKEKNRRAKRREEIQEDPELAIKDEFDTLHEYLNKLSIFATDSKLVLLARKAVLLIPQIIGEAKQLVYLTENPTPPDFHVKKSHRTLDDDMAKPYWKALLEFPKKSVKIYSNVNYYTGINSASRAYNDTTLKKLHNAIKSGTLTEEQKQELSQFSRTVNEKTISGEEMIQYLAGMQEAAKSYKTTEPLLLRRRVSHLNYFQHYTNGDIFPLTGITSTFGTESAFNNPKFESFGKAIIEFRVPVGTHVIPIGNNGTSWQSLDEIALPHGTQVKLLERYVTTDPPRMLVEVIPSDVVEI
jgi:SPP1 gp7 family putative phage head morphogenesis protein